MNKGSPLEDLPSLLANVKQRNVHEPQSFPNIQWKENVSWYVGADATVDTIPSFSAVHTPSLELGITTTCPCGAGYYVPEVHHIGGSSAGVCSDAKCFAQPPRALPQLPQSLLPFTRLSSLSTCVKQRLC